MGKGMGGGKNERQSVTFNYAIAGIALLLASVSIVHVILKCN